jgi:hypothetical protein
MKLVGGPAYLHSKTLKKQQKDRKKKKCKKVLKRINLHRNEVNIEFAIKEIRLCRSKCTLVFFYICGQGKT